MDAWTREILVSLGNGGTLDMAEGVVAFLDTTRSWARGIPVECIGGLSEVAERLGRGKTTVRNWIAREPLACPQPFAMLAATPLWDLNQWDVWATGHPDLVGQDQP
jgi:hypothetical protein